MTGKLTKAIRAAVAAGTLQEPFGAADVKRTFPGFAEKTYHVFLPKHRVGNLGGETELFVREGRGQYRLNITKRN